MVTLLRLKLIFILTLAINGITGCTLTPHHAIAQGNYKYLEEKSSEELSQGVFGNDWLPIHVAASQGNIQALQILIKKGVDLNKQTYFPVNNQGVTPLILATTNTHLEAIELLVSAGADVNQQNAESVSPLIESAANNQISYKATELLSSKGADLNHVTKNGDTALHWAVARNNNDKVNVLLSRGANTDVISNDGFSPLHLAVLNKNASLVKALLLRNANPNISGLNETTPIQEAAFNGSNDICKILIEAGADVNHKNKFGLTALHYAAENQHKEAISSLLEAGADKETLTAVNDAKRNRELLQMQAQTQLQPKVNNESSSLWATAFVGMLNVAANLAYPSSNYRPAPYVYIPSTQPNYVAPTGCTSDLACGVGMLCVKPPLSSTGQCMKPVDSYGAPLPGSARPGSSLMNTSPVGQCTTTTDCPVGFRCDLTLKACVK